MKADNTAAGDSTPTFPHLAVDIDGDLNAAGALNDLVYWIAHARQFIRNVKFWAEQDTALGDLLSAHKIALGQAEWDDQEDQALQYLQLEIAGKLLSMRAAVNAAWSSGAKQ